jgi:hypothetical protein
MLLHPGEEVHGERHQKQNATGYREKKSGGVPKRERFATVPAPAPVPGEKDHRPEQQRQPYDRRGDLPEEEHEKLPRR